MINNYKNLSEPVKASGAYMVCSVLQKCILMISTPIFTRLMTTEQYGEVNLFNSWLSIVTIFASLKVAAGGFNSGLERFYEKKRGIYFFSAGVGNMLYSFGTHYIPAYSFWNYGRG